MRRGPLFVWTGRGADPVCSRNLEKAGEREPGGDIAGIVFEFWKMYLKALWELSRKRNNVGETCDWETENPNTKEGRDPMWGTWEVGRWGGGRGGRGAGRKKETIHSVSKWHATLYSWGHHPNFPSVGLSFLFCKWSAWIKHYHRSPSKSELMFTKSIQRKSEDICEKPPQSKPPGCTGCTRKRANAPMHRWELRLWGQTLLAGRGFEFPLCSRPEATCLSSLNFKIFICKRGITIAQLRLWVWIN